MAQPNPGGQPPTFKSNVNRAKTKKWMEAKSYSYDGDDWGDVDDYDEYGGYDDPPPPPQPTSRATGLRQRGQSASQPGDQHGGPPVQQLPYGELGPSQPQQPYGGRSFTQPSQPPSIHRQNSFDPNEERRAFSGGPPQPGGQRSATGLYPASMPQNQPAVQDSQSSQSHLNRMGPTYQGPPPSNMPNRQSTDDQAQYPAQVPIPAGPYRGSPSPQRPGQPNMDSRSQSIASNNSSLDFHNRRDFSPSAMPPPLQTRGSPSPNRGGSRPPRTSSLGQDNAPPLPFSTQAPISAPPLESASAQRPQRDRASSTQSNKSLPFVRPADIYRRMEEERERERQSQESSRPSMEAIMARPKLDNKRDSESGGRLRQMSSLDPVQERRQSEFALEGLESNPGTDIAPEAPKQPAEKTPTTSKRFEIRRPSNTPSQAGAPSLGPVLPDVARMSGFGDSFGESFMGSTGGLGDFSSPRGYEAAPARDLEALKHQPQSATLTQAQGTRGTDLQHQPSLGFTSAVHQSFDTAQEQVPPTPSSIADSSIERSASDGTSTVSPIISRGVSTAMEPWNNNLPTIEDVTSPTQQQQVQPAGQRPASIARKPSPSQAATEQSFDSTPPPSFIPGHRRDMSTPSPDNSPARTPALEANRSLRSPQEVELAETTPTPTESEDSADDQMKRASRPINQYPTPDQLALSEGRGRTAPDQARISGESAMTKSPISPIKGFAHDRTDSAGSNKVRNLADKFEGSGSRPQSSHSNTTPRASVLGPGVPGNDDLVPPRPINERMESFRPHLPGGWESSASIVPAGNISGQATPAQSRYEPSAFSAEAHPNPLESQRSASDAVHDTPSAITQVKDASQDAFVAAATAGSALAASFAAAAGMGHKEEQGEESENEWEKNSDDLVEPAWDRGASSNKIVQPEAPKPILDPRVDKEASVAPTPLPKDTPKNLEKDPVGSDYFPDSSLEKPPAIGNHRDNESPRNSHQLPPLSTDLQYQRPQYESDRLRREIVKELAPNTASEPTTADSNSPYQTSSRYSTNQSAEPKSNQESGVVPRDYENYWNDGHSEEDGMSAFAGEPGQVQEAKTIKPHQRATVLEATTALGGAAFVKESAHHDAPKEQATLEAVETSQPPQDKPHILPHRFSWEAPLQELGPQPVPELASTPEPAPAPAPAHQALTSDFLRSAVYPEGYSQEPQDAMARETPKRLSNQSSTVAETSTIGLNNSMRSRDGNREAAVDSHDTDIGTDKSDSRAIEEARRDKELPSYPGDAPEVAQFSSEKQFLDTSSFGPGSDRQSNPSPALQEQSPPPAKGMSTPVTPRNTDAPLPPAPASAQPNIPSFRSLLALKTPTERIRAYNNTREQFANLNTGLAHWLAVTTKDLPEHSDLLSNQGRVTTSFQGHKSSPSRSGGPSGSTPSSTAPTYAPGFSPSGGGGKISSKEVQAKSKEFLHTAGVFGGKGIVAGKGLFSKGKSKLRGTSGTDKALQSAIPSSSPDPTIRGTHNPPKNSPARSQERDTSRKRSISGVQAVEPQRYPSESTESDRNTPSEQSYSKGQLGDDERSSEDYESAESGPEEAGPPPPRSSSLFIGDKNVGISRTEQLSKPTTSGGGTARTITHQTANAGTRKGTQSPRSTNSSNKTPTQLSFDHSKAMQTMPYPLERTESPQDLPNTLISDLRSHPSRQTQSPSFILPKSRYSNQNLKGDPSRDVDSSFNQMPEHEASSTDQAINTPLESEGAQSAKWPFNIRTSNLLLPTPKFSPLTFEPPTGLSVLPDLPRDPHSRGLSIGSIPSALDPERPPSPVSPFVPPGEDPLEEQRGRTVVPIRHGIDHDFVEESSVERARRRSPSFSRPFQTGRTSEDSRPFIEPDLQNYPAFRPNTDSGEAEPHVNYNPGLASGREPSRSREQAPEYQSSGQGAPDIPPVETKPRSRRGSRSSAYLKAIRDSVSPSRKSQARERSQPSLPDSSMASDNPHSAIRVPNPLENQEKPRRSSIFGRTKTSNSSRSDQAQSKDNLVPRAVTMPVQQPSRTNTGSEIPIDNSSPASSKISAASRLTQKLQRASTTVNLPKPEPEGGKKKRFSGIGSLFGRNQKRQSSDQFTSVHPQHYQHYGKYTGRPHGPTHRFPLDEDLDEVLSPAQDQYTPHHSDPPSSQIGPARQPQPQPQRDLPAYVQDRMLRQPTVPANPPRVQRNSQPIVKASPEILNPSPTPSPFPTTQPDPVLQRGSPDGSRPAPVTRSTGSWSRFSKTGRSNSKSQRSQTDASPSQPLVSLPHIKNFVSSPPLTYESRPTQRSWIEGTTPPPKTFTQPPPKQRVENDQPARSKSPPPPPPPPKDERWNKSPSSKPLSNHARTGSMPLEARSSPAAEQRQSLPPLQTNLPSSHTRAKTSAPQQAVSSGSKDKESMTSEERRKSRQEEIEKSHLSPASASSAQKGKMSVLQEDEGVNEKESAVEERDEPIEMSATSFPGQMWQPDYMAWEDE